MGKPYASELECLAATYDWALNSSLKELSKGIAACATLPLIIIGSGGSLTTAHYAASLHQKHAKRLAKAMTPLESVTSASEVKEVGVMFLSAGGSNPDIIGAFKHIVAREPSKLLVVCSRRQSPLSEICEKYRYVDLFDFDLPTIKDGFLATNSLLAFAVILYRAWTKVFQVNDYLPDSLGTLIHPHMPEGKYLSELAAQSLPLWSKQTISVLYGPSTQAAALDVESKFTEAALGSVQIADYRNFAHGRHLWLAKKRETTGVLALVTDEDRELANKTLRLIPSDVPIARVEIPHRGAKAGLAALVTVLYLVGEAGRSRGIDPGRPGVPQFGSKIYNLKAFGTRSTINNSVALPESTAIERKTGLSVDALDAHGELSFWRKAYKNFFEKMKAASFKAIVFDYDGTLCDGRDRYVGVASEIVEHLTRLLSAGVFLGIATGRGKSVKDDFRRHLPPALWSRVMVGYYNCADNGLLDDDSHPDSTSDTCADLAPVAQLLKSSEALARFAKCTYRRMQITVEPTGVVPASLVWGIVQQLVLEADIKGVTVVRSSHSVDVLAPHTTKQSIVRRIQEILGLDQSTPVLCVGDRGLWPGNDFALLKGPYSLSVDEVSSDPETCWNLTPPGHRGVQGTLDYLKGLKFKNSSATITFP